MTRRLEKVADLIQSEVAELLRREVKHPALTDDVMISITRVEVAPDLATARLFVSIMGSPDGEGEVLEALERTAPFLHHSLMKRLHMRIVPHLRFIPDHSIAEGDRIAGLLRDVQREDDERETQ